MYQINEFSQRELLDQALAKQVAQILTDAVNKNGKASIAVSGGSTPKGFFTALSKRASRSGIGFMTCTPSSSSSRPLSIFKNGITGLSTQMDSQQQKSKE